jgi:WD40 repeat protein
VNPPKYASLALLMLLALTSSAYAQQDSLDNIPVARDTPEISELVFSKDGRTLYSASLDGDVRGLDVAHEREVFRIRAHRHGVCALALSRDNHWLASAGADKVIRLWNVKTLKEIQALTGHESLVTCVAFSPDGKTLASGSYDHTIRFWDVATATERKVLKCTSFIPTALAFLPDGAALASGGISEAHVPGIFGMHQGDHIRVWNLTTGEQGQRLPAHGHRLAFAGPQRLLAAGWQTTQTPAGLGTLIEQSPKIFDYDMLGNRIRQKFEGYGTAITATEDGKFLASSCGSFAHMGMLIHRPDKENTKGVHLWELATGKEVFCHPLPQDATSVLAVSPDCAKIAAGYKDGKILFFSLAPANYKGSERPKDLTAEEWRGYWNALANEDARAAYEAIWELAARGDETVAFLRKQLHPADEGGASAHQVIADLDSREFKVRDAASRELLKLGHDAEPALREVLQGKPSAELRKRAADLLGKLASLAWTPEVYRRARALHVLERIGSSSAREFLRTLAQGTAHAALSVESKASLERVERRLSSK